MTAGVASPFRPMFPGKREIPTSSHLVRFRGLCNPARHEEYIWITLHNSYGGNWIPKHLQTTHTMYRSLLPTSSSQSHSIKRHAPSWQQRPRAPHLHGKARLPVCPALVRRVRNLSRPTATYEMLLPETQAPFVAKMKWNGAGCLFTINRRKWTTALGTYVPGGLRACFWRFLSIIKNSMHLSRITVIFRCSVEGTQRTLFGALPVKHRRAFRRPSIILFPWLKFVVYGTWGDGKFSIAQRKGYREIALVPNVPPSDIAMNFRTRLFILFGSRKRDRHVSFIDT